MTSWTEWDFDNFRFIVHELFIYAVACLIKYERFESVSYLLQQHYYVERNSDYGRDVMVPFGVFRKLTRSLDHRNERLKLRRLSLRADMLTERSKTSGITFRQLMQADFVLFIRDSLDAMRGEGRQNWWPITIVFAEEIQRSGPFEVFARAQSSEYFHRLKRMFDIERKDELVPLFEAFGGDKLTVPTLEFASFEPRIMIGFEQLATRP